MCGGQKTDGGWIRTAWQTRNEGGGRLILPVSLCGGCTPGQMDSGLGGAAEPPQKEGTLVPI